jgi:hypothetical protein
MRNLQYWPLIILWTWQHGTFSGQAIPLAAIALSAVLMPMRAITNIILGDWPRARHSRTNGSPISGRIPQHTYLAARI